jgi:hypothetical protein
MYNNKSTCLFTNCLKARFTSCKSSLNWFTCWSDPWKNCHLFGLWSSSFPCCRGSSAQSWTRPGWAWTWCSRSATSAWNCCAYFRAGDHRDLGLDSCNMDILCLTSTFNKSNVHILPQDLKGEGISNILLLQQ